MSDTQVITTQGADSSVAVATAQELQAHVQRVQQVMAAVMVEGTHYGKIPGTGRDAKPSLLKAGAEVLCLAFHIAPSYVVLDLGNDDERRYRVRCVGTHQGSARTLGEGVGECSSSEEKYKWRSAKNRREYELTDLDRRRIKFYGENEVPQVRTEPADQANTCLKMASKRAHVAMVLNVLAASDMFTQDMEDGEGEAEQQQRSATKPRTSAPTASADPGRMVDAAQIKVVRSKLTSAGVAESELLAQYEIGAIEQLPFEKLNTALGWIDKAGRE